MAVYEISGDRKIDRPFTSYRVIGSLFGLLRDIGSSEGCSAVYESSGQLGVDRLFTRYRVARELNGRLRDIGSSEGGSAVYEIFGRQGVEWPSTRYRAIGRLEPDATYLARRSTTINRAASAAKGLCCHVTVSSFASTASVHSVLGRLSSKLIGPLFR